MGDRTLSATWWRRRTDGTVELAIRVHPGAKRTEVVGPLGDELKVRVAAPPVDGKANTAVIRVLAEGEERTAGELSALCVLMPPSLSRILKTLTAHGLIARVEDEDARRVRVRLTPAGHEKYHEMAGKSAAIYARLEAAFGTARMEQLLDLLTDLRETADRLNGEVDSGAG